MDTGWGGAGGVRYVLDMILVDNKNVEPIIPRASGLLHQVHLGDGKQKSYIVHYGLTKYPSTWSSSIKGRGVSKGQTTLYFVGLLYYHYFLEPYIF